MLDIWLEICSQAGISEVLLNLHAHADVVSAVISRRKGGPEVLLSEERELLGSAGTLLGNRAWIEGEEEFWVFYADVLTNVNLGRILAFHRSARPAATIGVYRVAEPKRCGIAVFNKDFIVQDFKEKPENPKSDWAFSGVLIGTPRLLDAIPKQAPADLGFHVLPQLAGRMLAYPISEYLTDIGTMENYQAAQSQWPGLVWTGAEVHH